MHYELLKRDQEIKDREIRIKSLTIELEEMK